MGTVKVTNIEPIADNGTTTFGSSGDTLALATGTKLTGHGLYVVEKVDEYHYGTSVVGTSATSYLDIAGGNYLSFTPTSTSDIIVLTGFNVINIPDSAKGAGLGIKRDTTTSISSSSDTVMFLGRHAVYQQGSTSNYFIGKVDATDTNLTAGTTVYYEMYGAVHGSGGNRQFNTNTSESSDNGRHKLIGIHYKYIGT